MKFDEGSQTYELSGVVSLNIIIKGKPSCLIHQAFGVGINMTHSLLIHGEKRIDEEKMEAHCLVVARGKHIMQALTYE